jgi:hypothetical protein
MWLPTELTIDHKNGPNSAAVSVDSYFEGRLSAVLYNVGQATPVNLHLQQYSGAPSQWRGGSQPLPYRTKFYDISYYITFLDYWSTAADAGSVRATADEYKNGIVNLYMATGLYSPDQAPTDFVPFRNTTDHLVRCHQF